MRRYETKNTYPFDDLIVVKDYFVRERREKKLFKKGVLNLVYNLG